MKFISLIIGIVLLLLNSNNNNDQFENYVPNQETAIKVAEAIWLPIYGNDVLDSKPFRATLSKDGTIWTVKGTLPKGMFGGFPIIEIRKSDSKIIKVYHSK